MSGSTRAPPGGVVAKEELLALSLSPDFTRAGLKILLPSFLSPFAYFSN